MKVTHVRRKVMLSALAGAIMIPGRAITAKAAGENEDSDSPLLTGRRTAHRWCRLQESNLC